VAAQTEWIERRNRRQKVARRRARTLQVLAQGAGAALKGEDGVEGAVAAGGERRGDLGTNGRCESVNQMCVWCGKARRIYVWLLCNDARNS